MIYVMSTEESIFSGDLEPRDKRIRKAEVDDFLQMMDGWI